MRRAVITGLGAVTPVGNDVPTTWANLVAGDSGIDVHHAIRRQRLPGQHRRRGEGLRPDAGDVGQGGARDRPRRAPRAWRRRCEAVRDAGLEDIDPSRTGVIIGSAVGGHAAHARAAAGARASAAASGSRRTGSPNMLVDTTTSHVATHDRRSRRQLRDRVGVCDAGTDAIGDAAEVIKRDQADVILAGGTESAIVPLILAGFCAMRALADGRDDPAAGLAAVRRHPLGLRDGRGRGRADGRGARARAARATRSIYCEVVGYGVSNDAYHVATPHPESIGVIEMMRAALDRLRNGAGGGRLHQRARHLARRTTTRPRRWRSRPCSETTPTRWPCRRSSR